MAANGDVERCTREPPGRGPIEFTVNNAAAPMDSAFCRQSKQKGTSLTGRPLERKACEQSGCERQELNAAKRSVKERPNWNDFRLKQIRSGRSDDSKQLKMGLGCKAPERRQDLEGHRENYRLLAELMSRRPDSWVLLHL